jgi:hypothetical protein
MLPQRVASRRWPKGTLMLRHAFSWFTSAPMLALLGVSTLPTVSNAQHVSAAQLEQRLENPNALGRKSRNA